MNRKKTNAFLFLSSEAEDEEEDLAPLKKSTPSLFKLSDATGSMSFDKVAEGGLNKSMLDSKVHRAHCHGVIRGN